MHYEFEDAESREPCDPSALSLPAPDLLRTHRKVLVLHTQAGDLLLRYLPLRVGRMIDGLRAVMYPHYREWALRLSDIAKGAEGQLEHLPPDLRDEAGRLAALMQPPARLNLLGILVYPTVTCDEDAERLYALLTADEGAELDRLTVELSSPVDPADVDGTALDLADRYHVDYVDRELLDNLTVGQASYLIGRINRENEELLKLAKVKTPGAMQ